jgi:hypothetical protein
MGLFDMFGRSSTINKDTHTKLLNQLNTIVNNLVNAKNEFKTDAYNIGLADRCEKFQVVMESQLNKYLKIDLHELKDSIYLVPRSESVEKNGKYYRKPELCKIIATHYTDMLKIILTIKNVYDIEHSGDGSLARITLRNIAIKGKIFEMHYCNMTQYDYVNSRGGAKIIDFGGLKGFQYFCDNMLSDVERNTLIKIMRNLFARKKKNVIAEHMYCGDKLLSPKQYQHIMKLPVPKCNPKLAKKFDDFVNTNSENMALTVEANNPILHKSTCPERLQIIIDMSPNKKEHKKLMNMYNDMNADYISNINNVLLIATKLINVVGGEHVLKDMNSKALDKVKHDLKQNISQFYMQSIVNFQNLLDYAKELNPSIVDLKDRL